MSECPRRVNVSRSPGDVVTDISEGNYSLDEQLWLKWLSINPEVCGATVNFRWIRKAYFDALYDRGRCHS